MLPLTPEHRRAHILLRPFPPHVGQFDVGVTDEIPSFARGLEGFAPLVERSRYAIAESRTAVVSEQVLLRPRATVRNHPVKAAAGHAAEPSGFFLAKRDRAALRRFAMRPRAYLIGSTSNVSGS